MTAGTTTPVLPSSQQQAGISGANTAQGGHHWQHVSADAVDGCTAAGPVLNVCHDCRDCPSAA